jgi:arylsulfatase
MDFLQPDMTPKQNRAGFKMRTGKGSMAGPDDTAIGYGKGWATVSNTPFREYKHWVHEGGISTPLIAHWPARISRKNQIETAPSHLIDLMATAVDISGATYPETYHGGRKITPMEGKSLVPAFDGREIDRHAIYWEHEGNRAVRVGDWKLVAKGAKGAWELYNIAKDRSEQNGLASELPERVQEMADMWQAYAERAHVLPLNPRPPAKQKKKTDKTKFNHKQARFPLKHGDDLDRFKAPFVEGRAFTVSATVTLSEAKADGVIAAQGGVTHGWSLYLQSGEVCFATTLQGQRTTVRSGTKVEGKATVEAALGADGVVILKVDGEQVKVGHTAGTLVEQPLDGLQVGQDMNGEVGRYAPPFELQGHVDSLIVEVSI